LIDVRYAPIATKFCSAAKCRDVPIADLSAFFRMTVACSSDFSCAKTDPLPKQDSRDLRLKTLAVSFDHLVGKRK